MANQRGIPSLPSTLIKPTQTQPEPEAIDDQVEPDQDQGRGAPQVEAKPRARARRPATGGEVKGRKLSLPDSVFDRLQLAAILRKKTISAIATEILDRNLPKLRIERDS